MNKPNKDYELVALTPNEYWIVIHTLPSRRDQFMIHVNDYEWYAVLDRDLGDQALSDSVEVLERRLAEFAKRHNLPLYWHVRNSVDTLIEVE